MRPAVKTKIKLASCASRMVLAARALVGRGPTGVFKRSNLNWSLDLREGIDFSIWLLGSYEPDLATCYEKMLAPGATVLDVGANIGAHTLRFARSVGPRGKVHAFEPTRFAVDKLKRNLSLNVEFQPVVSIHHAFLGSRDSACVPAEICASWPLDSHTAEDLSDFCGLPLSTEGARSTRLDTFVEESPLERLDFIKLDVDGHEAEVLMGGARTIERFLPDFVVEIAPFVPQSSGWSALQIASFFEDRDYEFLDIATGGKLAPSAEEWIDTIPEGAGLNVLVKLRSRK